MILELLVLLILLAITVGLVIVLWLSNRVGRKDSLLREAALNKEQDIGEGYIGVPSDLSRYVGHTGTAETVLRPAGKVRIDGLLLDAMSVQAFIEEGAQVIVTRYENTQLYVEPVGGKN